jgi:rubrerythrin
MENEIKALLQEAISQAELSQQFYFDMAALVSQPETKDIFRYLAQNELQHKTFLERWLAQEVCPFTPQASDFHIAELLELPRLTKELSPKDALALAVKRKEASYKFYQNLASLQPEGETRDFLYKMAMMKLEDKDRLEDLFDNVAFPEVW